MTLAWFLAPARISAGPPMSMFSTQAAKSAPLAAVLFERIEIDGEKIDLGNGVIFERLLVTVLAAHREQPAMDFRMQRLHPPIHHFGALRDLGDVGHLEACLAQGLGGAAGGDELNALRREAAREIDEARLVADRKERAGNLLHGRMSREQS